MEKGSNVSGAVFPMLEGVILLADHVGVDCSPVNASQNETVADIRFYFYFYRVLTPLLFSAIVLVGMAGNALVISVIVSNRKMRTRVNVLLLNLALGDILFLVVCVPLTTYQFAASNWDVGDIVCKLYQYLSFVALYANMYSLVAISVMRYIMVASSKVSSSKNSRLPMAVTCVAIWVVAFTSNIFLVDKYKIRYYKACSLMPYQYCGLSMDMAKEALFVSLFIFGYVLPLVLVFTFYALLVRYIKKRQTKTRRTERSAERERKTNKVRSVSRLLLLVVTVLAVSWLPLHVHFLLSNFHQIPESRWYDIYRILSHVLAYGNSCMNPIIYNYVSKDFRHSFRDLVSRSCARRQE